MIPTEPDAPPTPESSRDPAVAVRLVTLADGRPWGLALPTTRYRPVVAPGGDPPGEPAQAARLVARAGYPAPIERLVADFRVACLAPRGPVADGRRHRALMALAAALLRRAHDVSPPVAAALLDLDGSRLEDLVDAVVALEGGVTLLPRPGPALSPRGGGDA